MVTTQWYDILGVLAVIFAGFSAMLVLVVYLEQWLAQPDPPPLASAGEQTLDEPDRNWVEHWAQDPSVQAGASHLPGSAAPGVGLDPPAARGIWARVHVFLPHAREQST